MMLKSHIADIGIIHGAPQKPERKENYDCEKKMTDISSTTLAIFAGTYYWGTLLKTNKEKKSLVKDWPSD